MSRQVATISKRLDPSDTQRGRTAINMVDFVFKCNAAGWDPKKWDIIENVRGLSGANFEGIKSYWRKHFMPIHGTNIMGVKGGGYRANGEAGDNRAWSIPRIGAIKPQVINVAESLKLCVPDLQSKLSKLSYIDNRPEYLQVKKELAMAAVAERSMTRLVEDLTSIDDMFDE